MKKMLTLVMLLVMACAPGQFVPAVTMTEPSEQGSGAVSAGKTPTPILIVSSCELSKAISGYLVCSHVDEMERPAECCQRCNVGTWQLQNCP